MLDFLKPEFITQNALEQVHELKDGESPVSLSLGNILRGAVFRNEDKWKGHSAFWRFHTKTTLLFESITRSLCTYFGWNDLAKNIEFRIRVLLLILNLLAYFVCYLTVMELTGNKLAALLCVALLSTQVHYLYGFFRNNALPLAQCLFVSSLFFYNRSLKNNSYNYLFCALFVYLLAVNSYGNYLFVFPLVFLCELGAFLLGKSSVMPRNYAVQRLVLFGLFFVLMVTFYLLPGESVQSQLNILRNDSDYSYLWFFVVCFLVEPFYLIMYIVSIPLMVFCVVKGRRDKWWESQFILVLLAICVGYPIINVFMPNPMAFRVSQPAIIAAIYIFAYMFHYFSKSSKASIRRMVNWGILILIVPFVVFQYFQFEKLNNTFNTYPKWLIPIGIELSETIELFDPKDFDIPFRSINSGSLLATVKLDKIKAIKPSVKYIITNRDHFEELLNKYPELGNIGIISKRKVHILNFENSSTFGVHNFFYPSVWPSFKRARFARENLYLLDKEEFARLVGKGS